VSSYNDRTFSCDKSITLFMSIVLDTLKWNQSVDSVLPAVYRILADIFIQASWNIIDTQSPTPDSSITV